MLNSAFDHLLYAFNADRAIAGREFEKRRSKLLYIFAGRGCSCAEELTDKVFDRAAEKLAAGVAIQNLDAYLFGVADFVELEHCKKAGSQPRPLDKVELGDLPCENPEQIASERAVLARERQRERCMKRCWRRLPEGARKKLVAYFSEAGRVRIENRKRLAQELEVSLDALRVEIHRLRDALEKCVRTCWARRKIGL